MRPSKIVAALGLFATLLTACGPGMARTSHVEDARLDSLKSALEKLGDPGSRLQIGWFDLDADGMDEALVMMTGEEWCGSGGCTMVVLQAHAASWKVVSKRPISRPPIAVLDGKSNGWRDLAVIDQGGGLLDPVTVVLKFENDRYVRHEKAPATGRRQVVIPD